MKDATLNGWSVSRREIVLAVVAANAIGGSAGNVRAEVTELDNRQLVLEWGRRWSAHDVKGLLALFTEDAVYEDAALGHKSTGRDELRGFIERTFVTFPDYQVSVIDAVADQRFGSGEWVMSGTFLGESFGQAPTGKRFKVPGCSFMRFAGRRISYHCDYWNESTFSRQVAR
jgi:steroid delta-isomerase-like uncharacterized protein